MKATMNTPQRHCEPQQRHCEPQQRLGETAQEAAATAQQVRLRAMEPEDLDLLYVIENDREVWSVGNTSVPYSRYVLHDYIANTVNDIYADGQVRLIIENAEHEAVGIADIVNFDAHHHRAEVSLVVKREHRRKGYAAATLGEIHRYALQVLHLHQLFAIVEESNEPSLQLFSRMGYGHESVLREWLFDGTNYHNAVLLQRLL